MFADRIKLCYGTLFTVAFVVQKTWSLYSFILGSCLSLRELFSLISEVDWEGPQASLVDLTQVYQLQYRIRLLSKRLLKAQCCNIESL